MFKMEKISTFYVENVCYWNLDKNLAYATREMSEIFKARSLTSHFQKPKL